MPSLHYTDRQHACNYNTVLAGPVLEGELTYILDYVAVVADEQEGTALRHIDLHANKTYVMSAILLELDIPV
jgi:hypothetical protein